MRQEVKVLMAGIMAAGLTDSVPLVGREPRKPHGKATQSKEARIRRKDAAEAKRIRRLLNEMKKIERKY